MIAFFQLDPRLLLQATVPSVLFKGPHSKPLSPKLPHQLRIPSSRLFHDSRTQTFEDAIRAIEVAPA